MILTEEKAKGRFYTPPNIVAMILDLAGYTGEGILGRHAIDNSCGDGAFLAEIVDRYCRAARSVGYTSERLALELGTFVHGIEIDAAEREKALLRVAETARRFGVEPTGWDIRRADALTPNGFEGRMDFVLGNPPYVRVHNLSDSYDAVRRFRFTRSGMTDLFLVFYEIGLGMLRPGGTLGYIAPSSLFNSRAAADLRRYFIEKNLIRKVVDLKHYRPFGASAYTAVMILRSGTGEPTEAAYYEYDPAGGEAFHVSDLAPSDFCIGGNFRFGPKPALARLAKIARADLKSAPLDVKNGLATLCDAFFIGELPFESHVIPVVKASTGRRARCLFPYDENGHPLPYAELACDGALDAYYRAGEPRLKKRALVGASRWYEFGRTQGIADVYKKKYSVCSIIREPNDLKLTFCDRGTGVYGGLYILTDLDGAILKDLLYTDDFMDYVALLGKYKSGGYYTFSSKDLKRYLASRLAEREGRR
ncbi:MAG: N-6 DNA methylase [Thermoguttaceae bacterium]|nr:N-6 DNA methylase [Thermoguttaceae bacterium]